MCSFGKHLVIEEWLKQIHCVIYLTKINFGCFMIWPVAKEDNMCQLLYCVDCGYIRSLNFFYLCRYTLLAISMRFILFFNGLNSEYNRQYVLDTLLWWFGVHLVIEKWFNKTKCVSCFTKIHLGCSKIRQGERAYTMY